jgi:hypothetical protein
LTDNQRMELLTNHLVKFDRLHNVTGLVLTLKEVSSIGHFSLRKQ